MRTIVISIIVIVAGACGFWLGSSRHAGMPAGSVTVATSERKIKFWWDPMLGPSSISDHPGKSAMGMDRVPYYEDQSSIGPMVKIDPIVEQNMGVTTAPVTRGPLTVTLRAAGMIQVPEPAAHDVTLRVNGYIQKLYADTNGQHVARGQVLFDLYSPELQLASQELIAAEQDLKSLDAKSGDSTQRDAQGMVDSARQKLRFWDIAEPDIDTIASSQTAPATAPFRSPVDGHLVDKSIVEGSAVRAGMKIMRLEDHSQLWLDMQVYEQQIPLLRLGQTVRATVDAIPGKTFTGKISFIYPHLDHMARFDVARMVLDNTGQDLKPGMYATAEIVTEAASDAVLVPREAVIDTGTSKVAFVTEVDSPGRFEPRQVKTGIAGDDGKLQILGGLSPGEQVVTSGQFLLDVESNRSEAFNKLNAGK